MAAPQADPAPLAEPDIQPDSIAEDAGPAGAPATLASAAGPGDGMPMPLPLTQSQTLAAPVPFRLAALPGTFHPLVDQIVLQASTPEARSDDPQGTQIILQPAELGRIRFALAGSGDQLTISVQAEQRDTLVLLQRHLPDLRAELAREGLGQATLSFGGWGSPEGQGAGQGAAQGQPQDPTGRWPAGMDLDPVEPAREAPRPIPRAAQTGGVDLRF